MLATRRISQSGVPVVVAALSLTVACGEPTAPNPPPTSGPGPQLSRTKAADSPILFVRDRGGRDHDIYSVMPDGSGLTQITNSPGLDISPHWSPDGTKIAYASEQWCNGCDTELYIANSDGSGAAQLTSGMFAVYGISWSPDGSRLAFESQGGTHNAADLRIYVIDVAGTGLVRLTNDRTFQPDWSPDGSRILFETYTPAGLSVMAPDGSNVLALRSVSAGDAGAAWSPDGKSIAYADQQNIWIMKGDGSKPDRVTDGPDDRAPAWSPDGKRIVFQSNRTGRWQIYTIKANGKDLTQVTTSPFNDYGPNWR